MHKKKKRTRILIGILCFFLGFLFAFIFEIGIIAGGIWFIATRNIDDMMEFIGLPNKDESGKNIYINTDPANGGSETLVDLVTNIIATVNDMSTLSIGKISNIVPATELLLDMVFDMTGKYIDIDRAEFESTPVAELPQFVVDCVMDIRGSVIMSFVTGDANGETNGIVKALLSGAEAEYATVMNTAEISLYSEEQGGLKLPVLYDTYTMFEIGGSKDYKREWPANGETGYPAYSDGTKLSESKLKSMGVEKDGEIEYERFRLYYVPCKVTATGIEEAEYSMGNYSYTASDGKTTKNFKVLTFGDDTDFIIVEPDADGNFALDHAAIWAAKTNSSDPSSRFLNYSYVQEYARSYYHVQEKTNAAGDITCTFKTISGLNYFMNSNGEMMDLRVHTLGDIMNDPYEPLCSVPVSSVAGGESDLIDKVFGKTSIGDLLNGKVDFDKLVDDMELSQFIKNISPENKLMVNLIFKLSDLSDNGDGTYSATYDIDGERKDAYVTLKDGFINKVYLNSDRTTVLEGAKIGELSETSNNIKLDKVMDIGVEDAIMRYLAYGITDVYAPEGNFPFSEEDEDREPYKYVGVFNISKVMEEELSKKVCYIKTREKDGRDIVDSAWYYEDDERIDIIPTAINEISGRIDSIMDYITLPDVIDVNPSQAIMAYVAYSLTEVSQCGSPMTDSHGYAYSYTCKYKPAGSLNAFNCYISVKSSSDPSDSSGYIDKVWYYDGAGVRQFVFGTKICQVGDMSESMKSDLTLGEVINIADDDEKILVSLRDTKINDLNERITNLTLGDILSDESIEGSPMLRQLKGVTITELADEIDNLLIQQIYSSEVYGLPEDDDPMRVVDYNASWKYYVVEETVVDGVTVRSFVPVNGDGVLSQADFNGRGKTVYYTYGKTTLDVNEDDKIKIAGFNDNWLYYEWSAEKKKYVLTELNIPQNATETERADTIGNLQASQYVSGKYYSYGEARGMWRLVLYKRVEIDDVTKLIEKAYSINNFNNMVNVCAANVNKSTLDELKEAGVINGSANLDALFFGTTTRLGDMTLEGLINAVIALSTSP